MKVRTKEMARICPGTTRDEYKKSSTHPVLFFNLHIQKPTVKLGIRTRNATEDQVSHRNAQEHTTPHFKITTTSLMIGRNQPRSKRTK